MSAEGVLVTRAGVLLVSAIVALLGTCGGFVWALSSQASQVEANVVAIEKLSELPEQMARVEERQIAQSEQLDILVERVERYKED
tara:strand:+ start:733 stop:987 length:255 start_codon:yes stop_codon:yes gene_type:complete